MFQNNEKKASINYEQCKYYEYMIRYHIAKLLPICITNDDWNNAELYHSTKNGQKFDIDIEVKNINNNFFIVFTNQDNKLVLPVKNLHKNIGIDSALKHIHETMIHVPIDKNCKAFTKQYLDILYNNAVQIGICKWLQSYFRAGKSAKNSKNTKVRYDKILDDVGITLYEILEKYDEWSSKTYEGNPVSFGIMLEVNPKEENNLDIGIIDILGNSDFAPIIETPNSLFKINENGKIIKYCSNIESSNIVKFQYYYHPLELREYIRICKQNLSNENSSYICIALTKKSEIAIIENDKLLWLKRDNKWRNMEYSYFKNSISTNMNNLSDNCVQKIYCNVLNVAFSKTGGCLAIIEDSQLDLFKQQFIVNNWFDFLTNSDKDKIILDCRMSKLCTNEQSMYRFKIEKNNIIKKLINNKTLFKMDLRLLLELLSMDGATIIDCLGNICATSSIVDLSDRGSGGGRAAATKSLSNYGIAIKISTDGYFEIYYKKSVIYSNK